MVRAVVPSWCVVCDRELPWRDRVTSCCAHCWSDLPKIRGTKCASCALPLASEPGARCIPCQIEPGPLDWCDAWGEYRSGLEPLLHAFKFGRHDFLAAPFGGLVHETLAERGDLAFDALVPVPMSRGRQRRRGYNQAELLANAVSGLSGIRCAPSLLRKVAERDTQSHLPREARAANVRGAFAADAAADGKALLIIDDICTTGETLRACARELLRAGASRVSAVTLAKAG